MEKVVAMTTFFFWKKISGAPNLLLFSCVFVKEQPNLHGCIFIL
jgi:hypothetical protein